MESTRESSGAHKARRGEQGHGAWSGAGSVEFGLARSFQEADVSSSVRGGAKMDAKAVVLKELERGRNSDKLANALSLLATLR